MLNCDLKLFNDDITKTKYQLITKTYCGDGIRQCVLQYIVPENDIDIIGEPTLIT